LLVRQSQRRPLGRVRHVGASGIDPLKSRLRNWSLAPALQFANLRGRLAVIGLAIDFVFAQRTKDPAGAWEHLAIEPLRQHCTAVSATSTSSIADRPTGRTRGSRPVAPHCSPRRFPSGPGRHQPSCPSWESYSSFSKRNGRRWGPRQGFQSLLRSRRFCCHQREAQRAAVQDGRRCRIVYGGAWFRCRACRPRSMIMGPNINMPR